MHRLFLAATFAMWPAFAQTTTPITIVNATGITTLAGVGRPVSIGGTGTINPLGSAAVSFSGSQDQDADLIQGAFTFSLSRVDSFSVTTSPQMVNKMTTLSLPGQITGGTGAYSGATGSINYNFAYTGSTSSVGTFTLTGSGSITVGKTTTAITLANFSGPASVSNALNGSLPTGSAARVAPFGNVTVNFSGVSGLRGLTLPLQGVLTFVFNNNDTFVAAFTTGFGFSDPALTLPCTIIGGTGAFQGATGSLTGSFSFNNDGTFTLSGSGSITQPLIQPAAGVITSVITAFGASAISQNNFIVIKGSNLVPASTPAAGAIWSTAPSFLNGLMPTELGSISVMVDNKPAFVYFYCSAATDPDCAQDQLNILTPLDGATGPVPVVVTNGTVSTLPFYVSKQAVEPSLLLFSTTGYVVATHLNGSLLGPIGLYSTSTPAKPAEQVVLYAVGFGLPATALVNGSSSQSGSLPMMPVCQVGGMPAGVVFAGLITPGLYQMNVNIPTSAANGDNAIQCSYGGLSTPAGNLITVQR